MGGQPSGGVTSRPVSNLTQTSSGENSLRGSWETAVLNTASFQSELPAQAPPRTLKQEEAGPWGRVRALRLRRGRSVAYDARNLVRRARGALRFGPGAAGSRDPLSGEPRREEFGKEGRAPGLGMGLGERLGSLAPAGRA